MNGKGRSRSIILNLWRGVRLCACVCVCNTLMTRLVARPRAQLSSTALPQPTVAYTLEHMHQFSSLTPSLPRVHTHSFVFLISIFHLCSAHTLYNNTLTTTHTHTGAKTYTPTAVCGRLPLLQFVVPPRCRRASLWSVGRSVERLLRDIHIQNRHTHAHTQTHTLDTYARLQCCTSHPHVPPVFFS